MKNLIERGRMLGNLTHDENRTRMHRYPEGEE